MPPRQLSRILYAEDEAVVLEMARLVLEDFGGFEVATCTSGVEVASLAQKFQPDLVLLDVVMPDVDGPAALEELRAVSGFASTPVIFMTALKQENEVEELKSLGAIDVIIKPFDAMTLSEEILSVWERHHG